jgi:hypothetical protein
MISERVRIFRMRVPIVRRRADRLINGLCLSRGDRTSLSPSVGDDASGGDTSCVAWHRRVWPHALYDGSVHERA